MQNRNFHIKIFFSLILFTLIGRIFYLQIIDNNYTFLANKNIVCSTKIFPQRGLIKDRNGEILVYNEPIFNICIAPKNVKNLDIKKFCSTFNISEENFQDEYKKACRYSFQIPHTFVRNISNEEFAILENQLINFKDVIVEQQFVRRYKHEILANVIGYVNKKDKDDKYVFGVTGLEKQYDDILTGKIGIRHDVVDVRGRKIKKYKHGNYDVKVENGEDISLSIDYKLQEYGEQLMKDKIGSVVAIQPQTGEVLAMISSPTYNPNDLILNNNFSKNYAQICFNEDRPLLNRTIMCSYPPASTFKLIQGMMNLDLCTIDINTYISCNQSVIKCHSHNNPLNIIGAIANSCNYFFVHTLQQMLKPDTVYETSFESAHKKLPTWNKYVHKFFLGYQLGIDLPEEKAGFIPTKKYYDCLYGKEKWNGSMIRSLGIGQGEILATPLQLANLAVIFANKGFFITPHLNRNIIVTRYDLDISKKNLNIIRQGMRNCITTGNGKRAAVEGIEVCGKSGTAQNHTAKDHSAFIAFAPKENPTIAIAVYLEKAGWGAVEAAMMCSDMLNFYFRGEKQNFLKFEKK